MNTPSARLYDTLKEAEGLRLTAYLDTAGVWTIGYGTTTGAVPGVIVKKGMTITEAQAEAWLQDVVNRIGIAINDAVKVPLTQQQFDALVHLVYNIGAGNFRSSTVLKRLNSGDYKGAADAILWWNRETVDGQKVVSKGLSARRAIERKWFLERDPALGPTFAKIILGTAIGRKASDMFTAEQFGGIVRTILAAGSGALISRGVVDQATATAIIGALGTIATAGWSLWAKRKTA